MAIEAVTVFPVYGAIAPMQGGKELPERERKRELQFMQWGVRTTATN